MAEEKKQEATIIQTDIDSKDGQNKCPKCGATDISLNVKTGKLRCNFCRHEFEAEKVEELDIAVDELDGEVIGSGATDITSAEALITLKCTSCGAEVVIDTESAPNSRCHWCRNTLSINKQIPNGSIPDVILPFSVLKEDAEAQIKKFVNKRRFFAHPVFRKEFTTDNIMGVYYPYMIVDSNTHVQLKGKGEHLVRRYTVGSDENKKTYYDADEYHIEREFDLFIDNLSVESSLDKLKNDKNKTNNIINAVMPFDVDNAVKFDANYIKGYTSEKRDVNIDQLRNLVNNQTRDIAVFAANDSLKHYDRGVRWDSENIDLEGQKWEAAYLPIWLYSYQQKKGSKSLLHYVAVNARTKETMGSIPINFAKLFLISFLVEILTFFVYINVEVENGEFMFLTGVVFFALMYARYRNAGQRHYHELETETELTNMQKKDELVRRRTRLRNSSMTGANNKSVTGAKMGGDELTNIINKSDTLREIKKGFDSLNDK